MCRIPSHNNIFKTLREEKGERHHFKKMDIEMETIPNLCASGKNVD
jgi:hypothetical protein